MASSSSTQAPSPAQCQSAFEQAVAMSLHLWPALSLAVQNKWGGPDSEDKRDWFAGAVVDLFPDLSKLTTLPSTTTTTTTTTTSQSSQPTSTSTSQSSRTRPQSTSPSEEPDQEDIETVLLQVMLDEFEVNVDDDSAFETAEQIMRVRGEVLRGKLLDGSELQSLRNRFDQTQKKGAGAALAAAMMFKRVEVEEVDADGEHEEWATDSDDDDDDEDGDEDVEMGDAAPPKPAEKKGPEVDEDGFTKVTRKKR